MTDPRATDTRAAEEWWEGIARSLQRDRAEFRYCIAAAIASDERRGELLSAPDGSYSKDVFAATDRVLRLIEERYD